MKIFKRILLIIGTIIGIALIVLYILFYRFSTPKSDKGIHETLAEENLSVSIDYLDYEQHKVRMLSPKNGINNDLPTILFVHGAIGSSIDFKMYMADSLLSRNANMIAYDRIGYGPKQKGVVLNSIEKETELLEQVIAHYNLNELILVGYSFGGPIALNYSLKHPLKKVVLCAPALYAEHEKVPGMIWFYKSRLTRFLVPDVWKSASKEKLSHAEELQKLEGLWGQTKTTILDIHGNSDGIVPYENSLVLQKDLSPEVFALMTLEGEGHGLVWSSFSQIRDALLKVL